MCARNRKVRNGLLYFLAIIAVPGVLCDTAFFVTQGNVLKTSSWDEWVAESTYTK